MTSSIDSISEIIRTALSSFSSKDQEFFLKEKNIHLERQIKDSSLLDQLCWVRLIRTRLSEGYKKTLNTYKEKLKGRTGMMGGWRKSPTMKATSEYESPMPWLHPFKLAGEELQPLEDELKAAVVEGETYEKDLGKLQEVLDKYKLQLPLPSPSLKPKYTPRPVRVYK